MLETLSIKQQMIMQIVWDAKEGITVHCIMEGLAERWGEKLAKTTVGTMCMRLEKKGFLKQGPKEGNAFTYVAAVSEEEYCSSEMERMCKYTFRNSSNIMMVTMLNTQHLTEEELAEIKSILERYEE